MLTCLLTALVGTLLTGVPAAAATVRVELRVLVVTDRTPEVEAIMQTLTEGGVPFDVVDLSDPDRPLIDRATLTLPDAVPHSRYQALVLPNEAPGELRSAELSALHDVGREFRLRQLNATVRPTPRSGLREPATEWSGRVGTDTARLTAAALADGFGDMRGDVPVDPETWVEIGQPQPQYETLLSVTRAGTSRSGPLMGVHRVDGREELGLSFSYEAATMPFAALAPGVVEWLTKGVHLGLRRSWFAVHVDDVLLPNARWVVGARCAYGADCPPSVPPVPTSRMSAADVEYAAAWSRARAFRLDLAYNGAGALAAAPQGGDPLLAALKAHRDAFGWINHTWSHEYLGCVRDYTVEPWRCATVPVLGWTRFVREPDIQDEIGRNIAFAHDHGLPINPSELVTGEHSGLRGDEEMPEDNPGLAEAIDALNVLAVASDASKEPSERPVGGARTVPRHPIDLDYDTATFAETVDQYNWVHTSRADGGDGACEADDACIAPADARDPRNGFLQQVVPIEADKAFDHVLANDPRPHYVHQTQLAEDRTLYPLLERVLDRYRSLYTDARPLLVPTMSEARDALASQQAWPAASLGTRAWIENGEVTVVTDRPASVPVTVPPGVDFGEPYGTTRSAWLPVDGERQLAWGRA